MAYRKLAADKLFDGYRFRENTVLVLDESLTVIDLIDAAQAGEDVELYKGILLPGFINCHCHLELSHLKGKLPERTGLVDFVTAVVQHRNATEALIADAIATAENAMRAAGIVAVGDICNTTHTIPQKAKSHLRYHNFIEASGWLPAVAAERLQRAKDLSAAFQTLSPFDAPLFAEHTTNTQRPTANFSLVPHAPYSVSEELWQAMQPHFANQIVSIHNQETRCEDEFFQNGTGDLQRMYALMQLDNSHHLPTGRTSLQSYFHHLQQAAKVILVHNTFITQEDIDYVMKAQPQTINHKPQTFFCLCPNANLYIEGVMPPVELFRKNNCSVVLGTDSLASNWNLSVLEEIKAIRQQYPQIPLAEMLRWATSNGAEALWMGDKIGSFEKGKKPGVVVIDEEELLVRKFL